MALSRTSKKSCAPKAATSVSAWLATSRAPELALMKAPRFRFNPTARSALRPGSAPRDKGTSRCSRKLRPISLVSPSRMSTSSQAVRKKALKLTSDLFECAEEDLVIEDGKVSIVGIPGKFVKLGDLANHANPMRGAVEPGTEPGLESTQYFGPKMGATANGVHAMIVEMDPRTFDLKILKYVVVHDCGTVINPMILAGQIHGGVAQGIGNAFYEKLVFDDQGQLLNASLADYLLPTALEVPRMELGHTVTKSPLNPLGIKGAGEAGAIPAGPLFAQAIEDALDLKGRGVELLEIPLSPSRLFELTRNARV